VINWKGSGEKAAWPNLRYDPSNCLEGLREATKTCHGSRYPCRYLNPGPLEFEAGVLTTQRRRSIREQRKALFKSWEICRHYT
jgi:hypothetical protein